MHYIIEKIQYKPRGYWSSNQTIGWRLRCPSSHVYVVSGKVDLKPDDTYEFVDVFVNRKNRDILADRYRHRKLVVTAPYPCAIGRWT